MSRLSRERASHRMEDIAREVRTKGFPELRSLDIELHWDRRNSGCIMRYRRGHDETYHLGIDPEVCYAPDDVITGGVAHELAHITIDRKRFLLRVKLEDVMYNYVEETKRKNTWFYRFCGRRVTAIERETDLLVVQRGYGKELLALLEYHDARHEAYTPDDGLTQLEVRELLAKQVRDIHRYDSNPSQTI